MKKILFVLLLSLLAKPSFGQDTVLFDQTWYLTGLIHDGFNYTIPSNSEVKFVTLNFSDDGPPSSFISTVCNNLEGAATLNESNTTVMFDEVVQTLIECALPANSAFELPYFNFFFDADDEDTTVTISIGIVDAPEGGEIYTLSLEKPDGDFTSYLSIPPLSITENEFKQLRLYPNPVANTIQWLLPNGAVSQARIFSLDGRLLKSLAVKVNQLNVAELPAGIYFLELSGPEGQGVKRFVKN